MQLQSLHGVCHCRNICDAQYVHRGCPENTSSVCRSTTALELSDRFEKVVGSILFRTNVRDLIMSISARLAESYPGEHVHLFNLKYVGSCI